MVRVRGVDERAARDWLNFKVNLGISFTITQSDLQNHTWYDTQKVSNGAICTMAGKQRGER